MINHSTKQTVILLSAALACAFTPLLRAQTPPANPPGSPQEEVLTLPEFSVSAGTASKGYTASDTVSGSRMNVAVKDLPYTVNSLTDAFFKDFSTFDLTDDLSYMTTITGNTDSFTFSLRGFNFNGSGNIILYNGHLKTSPLIEAFVERIELIKGPSGSIYGQSNPGGTLLVTTRQPTATQQESASVSAGSYDLNTEQIHASGPIPIFTSSAPKLFYNVDAEYLHRLYDAQEIRRQEKAIEAGLLYKLNENTSFSVEYAWELINTPAGGDWGLPVTATVGKNPYTGALIEYVTGFAYNLYNQHYGAPVDYVTRESGSAELTMQHRFTDWLSFQFSYDHYEAPTTTYNTLGSSGVYWPSLGLVANATPTATATATGFINTAAAANPAWTTTFGTGYSYDADLLAHWHFKGIDNQVLLTFDDYLNNRRNYAGNPTPGTFTPYVWAFNPLQTVTAPFVPRDSAHWSTTSEILNNDVEDRGIYLSDRAGVFNDRVFITGSYRHDYVIGHQFNPQAAQFTPTLPSYIGAAPGTGVQSSIHQSNDAPSVGVSVAITPSLSWYGSYYTSFTPFGTSTPLTVTIPATATAFQRKYLLATLDPPSAKGEGEETGFKGDFLDHALTFTVDAFDTHVKNVQVPELADPTNPSSGTVNVNAGDQKATGFEANLEYTMASGLHIYVDYSYLGAVAYNQGIDVYADGRRPRAAPYNSYAFAVTYPIPQVKGLRALVSMRGQGDSPANSPQTGLITNPATGLADQSNGQTALRAPSYILWNFGATYEWKWHKLDQSVNVILKNAFNDLYVQPGTSTYFLGDRRGIYATYAIAY
jgi:outer membrane receptor protein involved in Fe transport